MDSNQIIVGIGASAGGLEAINEFFDALPNDTDMAFVVVQHLSPDFKSMMDELLAKHTVMPIRVVKGLTPVKPNHIYLIDATSNLIIEKNVLKAVERGKSMPNLPIDEFFHSLGTNSTHNAIGIILSGTGADGSRGIRTLKEANGLIFAQTPETARFDGMPKMAIETGLVDKVLSPKEMAEALGQLSQLGKSLDPLMLDFNDEKVEALVTELLHDVHKKQGPNFQTYRRSTILRRIEKRMFLTKVNNLEAYLAYIRENPQELKVLSQEFLISVTRFFRDSEAFMHFQKLVLPNLFQDKTISDVVRIWVVGCATGEEAYTLAMLIEDYLEKEGLRRNFKIFASDLDANAIYKAGLGIYSAQISDDISPYFLNTYFEKNADGNYKIIKKLRDSIVFTVHDVLYDPPFINMDLLTCRNLLIYLNPDAQQNLFQSFLFALRYQGYLFLGPSESLGKMKNSFECINDRWNIYRSNVVDKVAPAFVQRTHLTRPKPLPFKPIPMSTSMNREGEGFDNALKRIPNSTFVKMLLKRYVPMSIIIDEDLNVLHAHGDLQQLLRFPNSPSMFNLETMVDIEEMIMFRNGLRRLNETMRPILFENVVFRNNNHEMLVDVKFEFANFSMQDKPHYLIELVVKDEKAHQKKAAVEVSVYAQMQEEQLRLMETEMRRFEEERKNLEEHLEAANEELQAANEELIATNEELQSTNEEMQSLNQELYTMNAELQAKVGEITIANSDLDNLLQATEIGTIFIDSNFRIRRFTPAIAKQFLLLESDIGRPISSFNSLLEGVRFEEGLPKVMFDGVVIEQEVRDKQGNYYLMRLAPYYLGAEPRGVVATFVNILSVHNVGTEAGILAKQFEAIFNHTDHIICVLDREGTLLDLNKTPEGYIKEGIIGANFFTVVIPKSAQPKAKAAFDKCLRTDLSVEYDVEVLMPDGKVHFYRNTMIPISKNGDIQRVICSSKDLTDAVEVAEKVRTDAAIFSNVFQHAREHIIIMNPQGIVLDINFTDAGFKKEAIVGKPLWEASLPEKQTYVKLEVDKVINGQPFSTYETDFVDNEGVHRWYQNILSSVIKDQKMERIVLISRDITDTKIKEQGLKQTNEALEARILERGIQLEEKNKELEIVNSFMDSFVHGAAHDLRSPLLSIKGFLELMPHVTDPDMLQAIYSDLSSASVRMERVLAGLVELIDFQRSEGPKPKLINLKAMILNVLEGLHADLENSGGKVETDLPDDLQVIYIEAYLQSIVYNLLHNAIKYRSNERPLRIQVSARREADGSILFSVKDNGMGMDLRRYGHFLFKPFRRLTVERDGTGIGLSIINNVVRKNGGRIEVESELDKGSTLQVYIRPYK